MNWFTGLQQKHIGCAVYFCLYSANDIINLQDFRFLMLLKIIYKIHVFKHQCSRNLTITKVYTFYGGFLFLKVLKPV